MGSHLQDDTFVKFCGYTIWLPLTKSVENSLLYHLQEAVFYSCLLISALDIFIVRCVHCEQPSTGFYSGLLISALEILIVRCVCRKHSQSFICTIGQYRPLTAHTTRYRHCNIQCWCLFSFTIQQVKNPRRNLMKQ